jgi:LmbE family N-acetylglucosaminyl deacetylase
MLVLHAAPHPDDELIGAPATLMALRDAGHQIVNVACSLGRAEDSERRRLELEEACRRARFELEIVREPLTDESQAEDERRDAAERRLAAELAGLLAGREFGLVVGPSPHDRHPGHEIVGRAVCRALESGAGPDRWWMWGLWGELPFPTTIVGFEQDRLDEILHALAAHTGELSRNDYRRLVEGRSRAATVLAAELVFRFGGEGVRATYAESTGEAVRTRDGWRLGAARTLDPAEPLPEPDGPPIGWWLHAPSAADRLRDAAGQAPATARD